MAKSVKKIEEDMKKDEKVKKLIWKEKLTLKNILIFVILILVVLALYKLAITLYDAKNGNDDAIPSGDKVEFVFYVMSQCPYGTQVEDGVAPVLEKMGDVVDFKLDFIVSDLGNGQFKSLHGEPETQGNIVQLCAAKYEPEKYMSMVVCMNKDARSIPGNWESCAKDKGLDTIKIAECFKGVEGKKLLSESAARATAAGASGSPTMFLAGKPYSGGRDAASFQRAICSQIGGKHKECEGIPACSADYDCPAKEGKIAVCKNPSVKDAACEYENPVIVEVTVLNDDLCKNCDSKNLEMTSEQLFIGAKITKVDVKSEEGKKLVEKYGIIKVPALVFSDNLVDTYGWKTNARLQPYFEVVAGDYKLMDAATGASWFVSDEKRQEFYKSIGVTLGDNKPQIDFFVMSYCPYGNQAEELIKPVYDLLKDKVEFNPKYVYYSNYQGGGSKYCIDAESKYCSMHGVQEANQDIREACVGDNLGVGKWFEFAIAMNSKCTSQNADACWEDVAKSLSLDTEMIKKCQSEKAIEIAKRDFDLGTKLSVSGSPAIFIDGEKYAGARTSDAVKQALCGAFTAQPEECKTALAGADATATAAPAAAGGCGV